MTYSNFRIKKMTENIYQTLNDLLFSDSFFSINNYTTNNCKMVQCYIVQF